MKVGEWLKTSQTAHKVACSSTNGFRDWNVGARDLIIMQAGEAC